MGVVDRVYFYKFDLFTVLVGLCLHLIKFLMTQEAVFIGTQEKEKVVIWWKYQNL
jgi:hypothetical protein